MLRAETVLVRTSRSPILLGNLLPVLHCNDLFDDKSELFVKNVVAPIELAVVFSNELHHLYL